LTLKAATHTYIGKRETNQDRVFAKIDTASGLYGLFGVADGMGGLDDGHYAATALVEAAERWWLEDLPALLAPPPQGELLLNALKAFLLSVNESVLSYSREQQAKLGTTCSLLLIYGGTYYVAHAGDSRIYHTQRRLFGRTRISQLTQDHSWRADQQRLGKLSANEIEANPRRNRLTSCIGVYDQPTIFTGSGGVKRNDTFIICSDGLYRVFNEAEIGKLAASNRQCGQLAKSLIDIAQERDTADNASVVAVNIT